MIFQSHRSFTSYTQKADLIFYSHFELYGVGKKYILCVLQETYYQIIK